MVTINASSVIPFSFFILLKLPVCVYSHKGFSVFYFWFLHQNPSLSFDFIFMFLFYIIRLFLSIFFQNLLFYFNFLNPCPKTSLEFVTTIKASLSIFITKDFTFAIFLLDTAQIRTILSWPSIHTLSI